MCLAWTRVVDLPLLLLPAQMATRHEVAKGQKQKDARPIPNQSLPMRQAAACEGLPASLRRSARKRRLRLWVQHPCGKRLPLHIDIQSLARPRVE